MAILSIRLERHDVETVDFDNMESEASATPLTLQAFDGIVT